MLTRTKLCTWFAYNSGPVPTYSLNFLSGTLDGSLTFARVSNAWYYNSSGVLTQAATNAPRFDYNPSTLALNGLLMEQQSTNYLSYSMNSFTGGNWSSSLTTSTSAVLAPDGVNYFAKLVLPAGQTDNTALAFQSVSVSGTYTLSIYAKSAEYTHVLLDTGPWTAYAVFDLKNGVVSQNVGGGTAGMQYVGNGVYRCYLTYASVTSSYSFLVTPVNGSSHTGGAGDGTSGVYVYGAQLEAGAFPTSYIPTTSSSVTRAADVLSNASPSFFNATHGTFVVKAIPEGIVPAANNYLASFNSGVTANSINLFINTTGAAQGGDTIGGTSYTSAATAGSPVAGTLFKQALAYVSGSNVVDYNSTIDGAGAFGAAALPSGITTLILGNNLSSSGTAPFNGWVQSFGYYNTNLSNSQLQGL